MVDVKSNLSDARDLGKGLLYNLLGVLAKISKALFVFVAARFYGLEALGLYVLAWSVADISSKLGLWGMDKSLVRDIARFNTDRSAQGKQHLGSLIYFSFGVGLVASLLVALGLYLAGPLIAVSIFHEIQLIVPLRLLALAVPFVVLTQLFIATTKGLRMMQYEVLVRQGIEPLVLLVGTLVLIPFDAGPLGLISAHIVASLVAAVAACVVALNKFKHLGWKHRPLGKKEKVETLRFTSPIALTAVLNLAVSRTDILLVGALINSASAGLYGIVVEITAVVKVVFLGLEPVFAPIVAELYHTQQKQRLKRNYQLVTRWLLAGGFYRLWHWRYFPGKSSPYSISIPPRPITLWPYWPLPMGSSAVFAAPKA
jgi:O-antigen/teichoic acid export membrane protein